MEMLTFGDVKIQLPELLPSVLLQNFLRRPGSTMKQCFGVIFMIHYRSMQCSYMPLSYKTELTTSAGLLLVGSQLLKTS